MDNSPQISPKKSTIKKWMGILNISLIIPILVFLIVGLFWWRVGISYQKFLFDQSRSKVQIRVDGIATSLASAINRRQALLTGLAAFIKSNAKDEKLSNEFEIYASGLYANDPVIRAIEFFPVDGYELVYPTVKNETLKGKTIDDLINDNRPEVRADVQRAIQSRGITLSNPYELIQGGKGVVARTAIYDGSEFLGLTVVVLNLEPLLEVPGLSPAPSDLSTALKDVTGQVFYGVGQVFLENPVTVQIQLLEGYWTVAAVPLSGWQSQNQLQVNIFWLLGILLAVLLSGLAYTITRWQLLLRRKIEVQRDELDDIGERFRRLFDTSFDAILITAPTGEVIAANPSACRIFGRTEDEIRKVGRNGLINIADPRISAALDERLRTGYFFGELTFVRKNGEIFTGEISTALYKDSQGRDRTSLIIRDISERLRSEEAERRSEEQFHRLAESSQDSIILFDREFHHVYENPAAIKISRKVSENGSETTSTDFGFNEELNAQWKIDIQNVFSLGISTERLYERDVTGDKEFLDWRFSPIFAEDGKVELVLGISRDITSIKQTEAALNSHLIELQRWHEVTLGREMRIRELKDEVNQLLVQTGQQLRYTSLEID